MEEVGAVIGGLLCLGCTLVMPIVALVYAISARNQLRRQELRIEELEAGLRGAWTAQQELRWRLEQRPVEATGAPEPPVEATAGPTVEPAAPPVAEPRVEPSTAEPGVAEPRVEPSTAEPGVADSAAEPLVEPGVEPTPPTEERARPVEVPGAASASLDAPPSTLEQRIALTWFSRIGAGVLLLGVAYAYKYAVDNQWIGPWGRVGLGASVGLAVLAAASWMKLHRVFRQILLGVAVAILSVTAYATYGFYELVPVTVAFVAVAVIALFGGALAYAHRSEAILVLSLLTGLANPVLLSTGRDQALGLFAYLLILTAVCALAAVRLRFVLPVWLSILGTAALFGGWYERFYDIAPVSADLRPEVLAGEVAARGGDYLSWGARFVPLLFVMLFGALWIGVRFFALRTERDRPHLAVLPLVALASMQVALAALMPDHPQVLGVWLSALSLLTVPLLVRARLKPAWMALPMVVSFLGLAVSLGRGGAQGDLASAAVAALWSVSSVVGLVRGALAEGPEARANRWVLLAVLPLYCALSGVALLPVRFELFAAGVVLFSIALLVFSIRVDWDLAALLGTILSALALLASAGAAHHEHAQPAQALLGLFGLWLLAQLAGQAFPLVLRRGPLRPMRVAASSTAAICALVLVLAGTGPEVPTMRAALIFVVGLALWVLGLALERSLRGRAIDASELEGGAQLLLGEALGLFAISLGLLYSGIEFSVAFLTLGAVTAAIAGRTGRQGWLMAALILLLIGLGHVLGHDLLLPQRQHDLFLATYGAEGELHPAVVTNPRSYGLLAAAVALLGSGWLLLRPPGHRWTVAPGVPRALGLASAAIGHVALLANIVLEVRLWARPWPSLPPPGLDSIEFDAFLRLLAELQQPAAATLAILTTLVLGAYGAATLSGGFIFRSAFHRYLGLAVMVVTLGKLAASDIWTLTRGYQVVVLISVGVLLLSAGFLYARFGGRIVALLRDGSTQAGAALALLAALGAASLCPETASAEVIESSLFRERRAVSGVDAAGLYRLPVDPPLYQTAAAQLADLRLTDESGEEVPFVVRPLAPPAPWRSVALYDSGPLEGDRARAIFDLGASAQPHDEVELDLVTQAGTFVRRVTVEASAEGRDYVMIRRGAQIYDVGDGHSHRLVTYPPSLARFLRVTIEGGDGAAPRITGARVSFAERGRSLGEVPLELVGRPRQEPEEDAAGLRRSVVDLATGGGVPLLALRLSLSGGGRFERPVDVAATNYPEAVFPRVASGWIFRADGEESLEIPLPPTLKRRLRVTIHDGNDQPLGVTGAVGVYRLEELVLSARRPGAHWLYCGSRRALPRPLYDLDLVLRRQGVPGGVRDASWGPLERNPTFTDEDQPPPAAWTEGFRGPISVALALAVLFLALLTWRLLRQRAEPRAAEPQAAEPRAAEPQAAEPRAAADGAPADDEAPAPGGETPG